MICWVNLVYRVYRMLYETATIGIILEIKGRPLPVPVRPGHSIVFGTDPYVRVRARMVRVSHGQYWRTPGGGAP